jgi:hypothetical protein
MKKSNTGGIIALVLVLLVLMAAIGSCFDDGSSKKDVAYDEDGFLGYSDSFWEWYADNN